MLVMLVVYAKWFWDLLKTNALVRYLVLFCIFLVLVGVFLFLRWWWAADPAGERLEELERERIGVEVNRGVISGEVNRADGNLREEKERLRRMEEEVKRVRGSGMGDGVNVNVGNGNVNGVKLRRGISKEEANRLRCEAYPLDSECR